MKYNASIHNVTNLSQSSLFLLLLTLISLGVKGLILVPFDPTRFNSGPEKVSRGIRDLQKVNTQKGKDHIINIEHYLFEKSVFF